MREGGAAAAAAASLQVPMRSRLPLLSLGLLLLSARPTLGAGRKLSTRAQTLLSEYLASKSNCTSPAIPQGSPFEAVAGNVMIKLNALAESVVAGTSWSAAQYFVQNINSFVDSNYIEYVVQHAAVFARLLLGIPQKGIR